MKKVLAWVLLLAMCLSLFAGCGKKPETSTTNTADLEAALEYIKTVYKKPSEKTPKDFQRISNVPVNGKNYEVVWTADIGEEYIKIVKGNDGMVTIDVNEEVESDVKYVLTATIYDEAGNKVSHSWNHMIPAAGNMLSIVEDAYKLESGESMDYEVTLTGKIVSIDTPWDAGYKNITVTIAVEGAEDKPIQCYRLSGEGADKLKPNDIITVTGKLKNYNGTIEFDAGCTLDNVIVGEKIEAPTDPKQILKEAYALAEGGALPYEATLTGVITKVNTEYNPQYKNVTVTIEVGGDKTKPIQCYRLAGTGADKIGKGDTITVTGWIVNYKGTVQFGAGCKLDSWKNTGKDEPKKQFVSSLVPVVVDKPVAGTAYKFFLDQKNREEKLYITGNMDGYYFETTQDPAKAIDVFVEEVSGGYRMYIMQKGAKKYLEILPSGTHKNVVFSSKASVTLKWNKTIKSFTCDVEGEPYFFGTYSFYKTISPSGLFRVTGENAGMLDTKGDGNFVARLATLKETAVSEEQKAFDQLKKDYPATETPTVTAEDFTRKNVYKVNKVNVKVAWTVDNEAVTIVDNGDGTVTVKVVPGENEVAYKLTATITDGKEKLTASWDFVVPAAPKDPDELVLTSIPEANRIGAAQTDYTKEMYAVQGVITKIDNTTYGNLYLADAAGNSFYVYGLYDANNIRYDSLTVKPAVGDVLVVSGGLGQYNGAPQMKNATIVSHTQVLSLKKAAELGAGLTADTETKYQVSGVITEIKNTTYGNVYIQDANGDSLYIYGLYSADGKTRYDALEQKPAVGDFVTLYGVMSQYKGTPQMKNAWMTEHRVSATLPQANTIGEAVANNETTPIKYQVTGTVTEIKNETYGNLYIEDAEGNSLYIYGLYDAIGDLRYDKMTVKPAVGDIVTIYGVLCQYKGAAQIKNGWLLEHTVPEDPNTTTVTTSVADYASANNWENGVKYSAMTLDNNITVTASGSGSNTGKYYTSGSNWRIYQSENPSVTLSAAVGKILSVKITYTSNNNGVLTLNGNAVQSGAVVEVNASSITFSVGNTGTATNGQARITEIEVAYESSVTVSTVIGDYAAAHSWANSTQYPTVNLDGNVTVTATGGGNTGKYYTSGSNWRIYQSENPSVTLSAAVGKILSVKITYTSNNNGVLTLNGNAVQSGAVVEVNASSITFSVGNSGTATNGQVRITEIEVVYGAASGSTGDSGNSGNSGSNNGPFVPTTDPISSAADLVYSYGSYSTYTNVIKNWGRRGYNATFLSPNAIQFYNDNNVTYETLAAKAGSSTVANVPSSELYLALNNLMKSNHDKVTSYGDTRYLYPFTDCMDQGVEVVGISAFYTGRLVGPAWDAGDTWNREHCWPKSKTETPDVSNDTTGECADIMTLRPTVSSVNSSRNNKAYGRSTGFYDPNNISAGVLNLRGDVARIVLYTYVRWENTSKMWGEAGAIESVDVLLDWIAEDPVDTWELGRNDSVESITGTRNVFVDYPELAFVLFGEEIPTMVTPSGKAA